MRIEAYRIESVSYPMTDRSVTLERLKNYRISNRMYRNCRIWDFLKKLYLTESKNTGLKKILNALEVNASLKPEFETDEDRGCFYYQIILNLNILPKQTQTISSMLEFSLNKISIPQIDSMEAGLKTLTGVMQVDVISDPLRTISNKFYFFQMGGVV